MLYHNTCLIGTCITRVSKVITKTFPWKLCLFLSTAGLTKGPVCIHMDMPSLIWSSLSFQCLTMLYNTNYIFLVKFLKYIIEKKNHCLQSCLWSLVWVKTSFCYSLGIFFLHSSVVLQDKGFCDSISR